MCDSPLLRGVYAQAQRIADETGARLVVVECRCSDELAWRSRIEARQALNPPGHHTTTWEAVLAWRAHTTDADYPIDVPHLIVETAGPDDPTKQVVEWLRTHEIRPRLVD